MNLKSLTEDKSKTRAKVNDENNRHIEFDNEDKI